MKRPRIKYDGVGPYTPVTKQFAYLGTSENRRRVPLIVTVEANCLQPPVIVDKTPPKTYGRVILESLFNKRF